MLYISGKNNDFLKYGEGLFFLVLVSSFLISPIYCIFFPFSLIFFTKLEQILAKGWLGGWGLTIYFPKSLSSKLQLGL